MTEQMKGEISRRTFIQRGVVAGAALTALTAPGAAAALRKSKIYTGKRLDDFKFSFAIPAQDPENTTYFVNKYIFGPQEGINLLLYSADSALDFVKLTASHHFNASHPSAFFLALVKDQGLPVKCYFDNMDINIFGWAVKPDSPIQSPKDLEGKNVAIGLVGWDAVYNPIVAAAGGDYKKITYIPVGLGYGPRLNALESGRVDAIVTWNGEFPGFNIAAREAGQGPLRFISGEQWLKACSNGWVAAEDRLVPDRDLLIRAARAQAKAMWFVKTNPVAAAKIFHKYYPTLYPKPADAIAIAKDYNDTGFIPGPSGTLSHGLGWNNAKRWQNQLDAMYQFQLTKHHLQAHDVFTNDMIKEINDFNKNEVIKYAANYKFH